MLFVTVVVDCCALIVVCCSLLCVVCHCLLFLVRVDALVRWLLFGVCCFDVVC